MFYRPGKDDHGLPFDPFKSCVVPRPIAWISTISEAGIANLAPFSFFNAFSWAPPMVAVGIPGLDEAGEGKDTIVNIQRNGEFVVNMATYDFRTQVNETSKRVGRDVSEFDLAQISMEACETLTAPRVSQSPIHLECRLFKTVELPSDNPRRNNTLLVGKVVGIHIRDEVIVDGRIDLKAIRPISRLGYRDWSVVSETFEQLSP